jgi:hypothetical protein
MKISILIMFAFLFLPVQPPIQQDEDLRQRTVTIFVNDADGNPVEGQGMELSIRKPLTRIQCTTDSSGRCEMVFGSEEDLVNGLLLIVGAGKRSVLFKGDSVEIPITLSEDGLLDIPGDFHSEPPPTIAPAEAGTPVFEATPDENIPDEILAEVTVTTDETESQNDEELVVESETPAESEPSDEAVIELTLVASDTDMEQSPTATNDQGIHWLWWLLAILAIGALGAAGWYLQREIKN